MKNKYIGNSVWIITGKILQSVIALVVGAITARYLGPSNYGIINYVAAYVTFFSCIANLGMNSTVVNELLLSPDNTGKIIGTMTLAKFISSAVSAVLVTGIVAVIDRGENTVVIVAAIYSSYLVFQSFQTFEYWYQSRLQSKVTALVGVFAYIVMSSYKVVLLIVDASLYWFAFSMSVDVIIIAVVLMVLYKKQNGPRLEVSWQLFKELFARSRPFILAGLIQVIYTKTDTVMLKHMLDATEVGIYTCASTLVGYGGLVMIAVTDSARPAVITAKQQGVEHYIRRVRQVFSITIIAGVIIGLGFTLLSNPIVSIIYGEDYISSIQPMIILAWNSLLIYLTTVRNIWIVCENKQKYTIIFCAMGAVVNIIANYLLIPVFGASGAAIATIIAQIISGIIAPCFFKGTREVVKYLGEAIIFKNIFAEDEKAWIKNKITQVFKRE